MAYVPKLRRMDGRGIPTRHNEIRAFLVVRNEALRLAATLRHHREIGVDRFFVIDNGSTDGTLDLISSEPDVHLFSTTDSYAASDHGLAWTNALLDQFGTGHWALTIDADELFIYPNYETLPLPKFCDYLTRLGAQAVFCLLLDMYSDQPFGAGAYRPGGSMLEACPYFDATGYRAIRVKRPPFIEIYGGVRERMFRSLADQGYLPPTVSKVPLIRWQPGLHYTIGTHCFAPPLLISDIQAVLLHFKFLHDFPDRARIEAQREEHFDGAREYKAYNSLFADSAPATFVNEASTRFESSAQLLRLGLMRTSEPYEAYCRSTPTR